MPAILRAFALLLLIVLAGCSRGPDEAALKADLQTRLDQVFDAPLLEVVTLRRQGSARYRSADDGSGQAIVYFNALLRFVEAYDPSDWESLSPALVAGALGATDRGIIGLGSGRHEPGAEFRSHGSLVYRKTSAGWVLTRESAPEFAAVAGKPPRAGSADELVQRLSQMVMQSPQGSSADREIIAEEIDRAMRNINLRLEREQTGVAVAAGPEGGEYWRFLLSVTRGLPSSADVQIVATEGSVDNAFMIESGKARLGMMQSDVAASAVTGQGAFAGVGPMSHLRAVASLFPEPVHIVVRSDSDIQSIADLAGRRVALGSPASGSRHTALRLLAAAGVDADSLSTPYRGDPQGALARLEAGELDAVIEVTSAPWQQLQDAARRTPLRLVGIDAGTAAMLADDIHGLVPLGMAARTYPGQDEGVPTLAATALLVARSDVTDATVEATLAILYSVASDQGGVLAARLSKERARTGITIPIHDGAQRFFERAAAAGASPNTD